MPFTSVDLPRIITFAAMILIGLSAIIASLITYFGSPGSDLRDLLLLCLIVVIRSSLLAMVIRFFDTLRWPGAGFVLLTAFMILTIWNETYDVTHTTLPVKREFPSVSSSKASILDTLALASLIIAIVPSTVRVHRLKAVYRSWLTLGSKIRSDPTRFSVLAGCIAWPGASYSIMIDAYYFFFINPNYGFIDFIEFVHGVNYIRGYHVHYMEGIVIYLTFILVSKITKPRLQRNLGLLAFCVGVIVAYAISFRWPSEVSPGMPPNYGPLLWSAPALLVLLASAAANMFSAEARDSLPHKTPDIDQHPGKESPSVNRGSS
ncbi:MAG: hypothetical protein OXC83_08990 [Chloroflexi bacterium]|nr:hypothetical protein [Chloroflexota bacterium]